MQQHIGLTWPTCPFGSWPCFTWHTYTTMSQPFHRKRTPSGEIKKFKARYCLWGDCQEGDFEMFALVAAWGTICIVLILALTHDWHISYVGFSNVMVQASWQEPVWIHLP